MGNASMMFSHAQRNNIEFQHLMVTVGVSKRLGISR